MERNRTSGGITAYLFVDCFQIPISKLLVETGKEGTENAAAAVASNCLFFGFFVLLGPKRGHGLTETAGWWAVVWAG